MSEQSPNDNDQNTGNNNNTTAEEIESTYEASVEEGVRRLERSTSSLLATGAVAGIDVSIGVFALMVVKSHTRSTELASLAFSIGFVALVLGRSELFTENFLVPVTTVISRRKGVVPLLRLWGGTAVSNLLGGYILAMVMALGYPQLNSQAVSLGKHFIELGYGARGLAVGALAGAIITLMTWMLESSRSSGSKLVAAVVAGFLLTAGEMNHCVVASVEMFVALLQGAPFGYLDWFKVCMIAAAGNFIGGIGLVTVLRLVQVGREPIDRLMMSSGEHFHREHEHEPARS